LLKIFQRLIVNESLLGVLALELIRGIATLPQGNQELLVVRDKVGRPQGELTQVG